MESQNNDNQKSIDIFLLDTRKSRPKWFVLISFQGTIRWKRVKTHRRDANPDSEPYMRYGHAVVTHDHHIYLWGGRNDSQGSCNKMWRFDGRTHSWSLIETTGDEPSGRDGHSMTVWRDKIVIFAGKLDKFSNGINLMAQWADLEALDNENHAPLSCFLTV